MPGSLSVEQLKPLLATPAPADLGPGPRAFVESPQTLNQRIDDLLGSTADESSAKLIRSLLLLWHDHLEASHRIAQEIETPDGSYVHGIMHRREPDYSNAKYWFRRVGPHPSFSKLAERAGKILEGAAGRALSSNLQPKHSWDPFAFIDACENACGRSGSTEEREKLQMIQAAEFEILLQHFCGMNR